MTLITQIYADFYIADNFIKIILTIIRENLRYQRHLRSFKTILL